MKLDDKAAEAFGNQLADLIRQALAKSADLTDARLSGIEARLNALELEAEAKGQKGKRK